ncbi:MAG: hypothetical protein P4M11_03760 [Candidatus Pacebacteria bacterium]|nr:hypothetical protein [Candidatus Paceibacterota bacterium]
MIYVPASKSLDRSPSSCCCLPPLPYAGRLMQIEREVPMYVEAYSRQAGNKRRLDLM